ncbi:MAG: methyltransferase [Planctomycetia bacterium]|nr:methyltransferase [Planctomycetia bacterium]
MKSKQQKEFGDYQTPQSFANTVCLYLWDYLNVSPNIIIEPTCGIGTFLNACSHFFDSKFMFGLEINEKYLQKAQKLSTNTNIYWLHADIFHFDLNYFSSFLQQNDHILLIGNPPWVNNSNLSSWNSENIPLKNNEKKLKGFDALTGSSNFDICESIILKLIRHFQKKTTTLAMLCKTNVAHKIFREMVQNNWPFHEFRIINFKAAKIFQVATEACLLIVQWKAQSENGKKTIQFNVPEHFSLIDPFNDSSVDSSDFSSRLDTSRNFGEVFDWNNRCLSKFGFKNSTFYSNLNDHIIDLSGKCCFEWRQGIKHDCASILELSKKNEVFENKINELVDIEEACIYPLIKSRDFKNYIINKTNHFVIVTQKKIQDDLSIQNETLPRTWQYLIQHKNWFSKRKSSIYKNRPLFSLFGIGDYSFSKCKVGISGFYKKPRFSLIYSSKPFMLDDTCYSISLDSYEIGYAVMLLLNSSIVQQFLKSLTLISAKRPFTKRILQQIDINKCLDYLKFDDLKQTECELKLPSFFCSDHYDQFARMISNQ